MPVNRPLFHDTFRPPPQEAGPNFPPCDFSPLSSSSLPPSLCPSFLPTQSLSPFVSSISVAAFAVPKFRLPLAYSLVRSLPLRSIEMERMRQRVSGERRRRKREPPHLRVVVVRRALTRVEVRFLEGRSEVMGVGGAHPGAILQREAHLDERFTSFVPPLPSSATE